jgi:transposase
MKRRMHTKEFKLRVLSELNSGKTIGQLSSEHSISPGLISKWKRQYEQNPGRAFGGYGKISSLEAEVNKCKKVIGELYLEIDFLKKVQLNLRESIAIQKLKEQGDCMK